jgi:poly(3-hydroxybutyrate) depolymerase
VFHGDQDKTVHPCNGYDVLTQFGAPIATLQVTTESGRVPSGHSYSRSSLCDANGQTVFENWVIHGGGHAWSGGSLAGSHTDPRGPDATREMCRFFLEQTNRRPGLEN